MDNDQLEKAAKAASIEFSEGDRQAQDYRILAARLREIAVRYAPQRKGQRTLRVLWESQAKNYEQIAIDLENMTGEDYQYQA